MTLLAVLWEAHGLPYEWFVDFLLFFWLSLPSPFEFHPLQLHCDMLHKQSKRLLNQVWYLIRKMRSRHKWQFARMTMAPIGLRLHKRVPLSHLCSNPRTSTQTRTRGMGVAQMVRHCWAAKQPRVKIAAGMLFCLGWLAPLLSLWFKGVVRAQRKYVMKLPVEEKTVVVSAITYVADKIGGGGVKLKRCRWRWVTFLLFQCDTAYKSLRHKTSNVRICLCLLKKKTHLSGDSFIAWQKEPDGGSAEQWLLGTNVLGTLSPD